MKEELISIETAKLAKEKGFDIDVEMYWCNYYMGEPIMKWKLLHKKYLSLNWQEYPAPTQSILQKWLREKHNIHIIIELNKKAFKYQLQFIPLKNEYGNFINISVNYKTHEKALEAGLIAALKLIKTKIK